MENNKYGWFWTCPNGGANCHYRHALPPGFVLKKVRHPSRLKPTIIHGRFYYFQDQKKAEKGEEISLEELIEQRRAELSARTDLTPVTLESFVRWKKRKLKEKADNEKKESSKKKEKFMSGMKVGLSGREMFTFDPKLVGMEVRQGFLFLT